MLSHREALLSKVAKIFHALYNMDLIAEATFLEWDGKVRKKFVPKEDGRELRKHAAIFIKWLQEAESEEESSEEESDEEEDEEEEEDDDDEDDGDALEDDELDEL